MRPSFLAAPATDAVHCRSACDCGRRRQPRGGGTMGGVRDLEEFGLGVGGGGGLKGSRGVQVHKLFTRGGPKRIVQTK